MSNNKKYILGIDVGNTFIKIGVFEKNSEKSSKIILIPTEKKINKKLLTSKIKEIINFNITDAIIGSVVPEVRYFFKTLIFNIFKLDPYFINEETKFSFFIEENSKKEIGDDLLALAEYCVKCNDTAMGISFGTATAAIYLQNKKLKGVSIAAGLGFGLDKLIEKASLLVKSKIDKFQLISYGDNTISSLESGINNLIKGVALSLYNQIKKENPNKKIFSLITGGEAFKLGEDKIFDYEINYEAILIGFKRIYLLNNK
ncbi:MAG: type III pantothenate kinase [Malacoplasma sp.]|nr:type III pantothenate kinase [Malacoplasma sp.]